jgi:excisionase family DNA binding protein
MEPLLLSLSQAAELLGVSPARLYELTRRRSQIRQRYPIPFLKLGHKHLAFRKDALVKWIETLERG